jgi:hypothetical protein
MSQHFFSVSLIDAPVLAPSWGTGILSPNLVARK